jgi:hypothetical protein
MLTRTWRLLDGGAFSRRLANEHHHNLRCGESGGPPKYRRSASLSLASFLPTARSTSKQSMSCACITRRSPTIGVSAISCRSCRRSADGLRRTRVDHLPTQTVKIVRFHLPLTDIERFGAPAKFFQAVFELLQFIRGKLGEDIFHSGRVLSKSRNDEFLTARG